MGRRCGRIQGTVHRLQVIERLSAPLGERIPDIAALITRQNGDRSARRCARHRAPVPVRANAAGGLRNDVVVRRDRSAWRPRSCRGTCQRSAPRSKLAPALAVGCPVVLKPSPETPLDAYLLAEIATEPTAPFGEYRNSGIGREMGEDGLRSFPEAKTISIVARPTQKPDGLDGSRTSTSVTKT